MWEISQLRHSKVYRSGNPPNRGVLRARHIGWAQHGQRGAAGAEFSDDFFGMAKDSFLSRRAMPRRAGGRSIPANKGFQPT
jgi:hypothetical protein